MSLQVTPPHTRIHQLFDERVAQAPEHPFLFMPGWVMSLGQLAQQVDALEDELREAGVRWGDRVLVAKFTGIERTDIWPDHRLVSGSDIIAAIDPE